MNDTNNYEDFLDQQASLLIKNELTPGIAITWVDKNKKQVRCFGETKRSSAKQINSQTIFQAGSLSKTLTAWGIMWLVEHNRIDLDIPVNNYLSRWKIPDSKFNNTKVTPRSLLSHTSGLQPVNFKGTYNKDNNSIESILSKSKTPIKIIQQPQTSFLYSGAGYSILQLLIEEITGETFTHYMKTKILLPLNMQNSDFDQPQNYIDKGAVGHGFWGQAVKNRYYSSKSAAGLYTTIEDMACFLQQNIRIGSDNYNKGILKPTTLQTMYKKPLRNVSHGLGYYISNLCNDTACFYEGVNLGWRSYFLLLQKHQSAICILSNCAYSKNAIATIVQNWLFEAYGAITAETSTLLKIDTISRINLLKNLYKRSRGKY